MSNAAAQQSRSKLTLWSLGGVAAVVLFKIFTGIADLASIVEAWKFLEEKVPLLRLIPDWVSIAASAIAAVAGAVLLVRWYARRQLRDLQFPRAWEPVLGHFANDPKLTFGYVEEPREVAELAQTEDYGDKGTTNVPIATEWWTAYRCGNTVARYNGRIIGGIDLWPIKKKTYEQMLEGLVGDMDLRPHHFRLDGRASYWYIGSISLAQVWRRKLARKELLVRLAVNTMQSWLSRDPTFPATFIALAWTEEGRNLLLGRKFTEHRRKSSAGKVNDPTYTLQFASRDDASAFTEELKGRLAGERRTERVVGAPMAKSPGSPASAAR